MSNLGTITQLIKEDMARLGSTHDNQIWRAIIRTIRDHRAKRFFFNENFASWTSVAGKSEYSNVTTEGSGLGYPNDLLAPDVLRILFSGSKSDPIDQRPIGTVRSYYISDNTQGLPSMFAWHDNKLIMDRSAHAVFTFELDYARDIGLPLFTYASNIWSFTQEDGSTALDNAYTNSWFTEGQDLLLYGAQKRLAKWLKSKEEMEVSSFLEDQALRDLQRRSSLHRPALIRTPSF